MKNKIILLPILFLMMLSFVNAQPFSFTDQTQITSIATNNTLKFIGYDYPASKFLYMYNNTSIYLVNSLNALNGTGTYNATCTSLLKTNTGNNSQLYVMPSGNYICMVTGSSGIYNSSHARVGLPTITDNGFYALSNNGSNEYYWVASGSALTRYTFPALVGTPALNCYSQIQTAILNNYGVNITAYGGFNQSVQKGDLILNNHSFYAKFGTHWFRFNEENQANCNDIATGFEEVVIDIDNVSSNDRYVIGNADNLYTDYKDGNQLYLFTSGSVDAYAGLRCDGSVCYNLTGTCINDFFSTNIYVTDGSKNVFSYVQDADTQKYLCTYNTSNTDIADNIDFYCDYGSQTICTGGCTNIVQYNSYGTKYYTGNCSQVSTCTNECFLQNQVISDSMTTYVKCGNYDADVCLEYSDPISCAAGEVSIDGSCDSTIYSGSAGNLKGFSTVPFPALSYNYNSVPQKASVGSSEGFVSQGFKTDTLEYPYFMGRNCNYTSVQVSGDAVTRTYNSTNSTFNVYYPTFTDGIYYTRVAPSVNKSILFAGSDTAGKEIYSYYIKRNVSNGICVFRANTTVNESTLYGCLPLDSDVLSYLDVEIQTIDAFHMIKVKAQKTINPPTSTTYYGSIVTFDDATASKLGNINTTIEGSIISYSLKTDSQLSDFKLNKVNTSTDYNTNRCLFSSLGCRTVRTYYMDYNASLRHYWNYKDWLVCVDTLGGYSATTQSGNVFDNLTNREKFFLGFGLSFLFFAIILVTAYMQREDSERRILTFASVFVLVGSIIFFTVIGWLQMWILITMLLLSAMGVTFFFIKKTQGE